MMDWPKNYKNHLIRLLWSLLDKNNTTLIDAEKQSLWLLLQQDEFINMKILSLSRVLPKVY